MNSHQIRESFLSFFERHGHKRFKSASLVPSSDPTLFFTNAGMVPFKEVFTGREKLGTKRATTSQKCMRVSGKHNDLENVGRTPRHHTFFEMLGNFSFGDYFKAEAITLAWKYLVEELKLDKDRLWITIYQEDQEAGELWQKLAKVPAERIVPMGEKDNFWSMGAEGPCGPCSEIHYDFGEGFGKAYQKGDKEFDDRRYMEIWNLVFMQYDRDKEGTLHPLPKPSVDTGMGLERMAAVMQHVHANYEIDLFQNLLKAAARETGVAFSMDEPSLKVIADHIRACSFLIADGVMPSNEGRGYVLRRIIRRAVRHGYKLGQKGAFFYKLVPDLVAEMGGAYPELKEKQTQIMEALRGE
ncbi:MAG: alanine--tRNA ligase, partial [Deltaproteobacteria bacterium]|nr:alanine--tRNA ligase [Deltaproteobacteria bacterium]